MNPIKRFYLVFLKNTFILSLLLALLFFVAGVTCIIFGGGVNYFTTLAGGLAAMGQSIAGGLCFVASAIVFPKHKP